MAENWLRLREPNKALGELRLAAKSSGSSPELLEQIGDLEDRLGNREAALNAWREAGQRATESAMRKRLSKKSESPAAMNGR